MCPVCEILSNPGDELIMYFDGYHWVFLITGRPLCGRTLTSSPVPLQSE